jgi:hypothetical protein|tara:strand:+ start:1964 stop:2383 length:420 start_codon:yes stop_codon:yes gene_type:complete
MARRLEVWEVFERVGNAETREGKIQILKENDHWAIRDVIAGCLNPKVEWNLPKGRPPYTANRIESIPGTLLRENTKFTYFVKGGKGDSITAVKREKIFIGILETVHPNDAELVLKMVEKKMPVKGLTRKIVEEAFPGLL